VRGTGGPVAPVTITDLSIPGQTGTIAARHYRPNEPGTPALLVYFHGGGFVFADLAALAAAGVAVDLREQPSMIHAFINLNGLGGGTTRSVADIVAALRSHLRGR
jgi:acetyl esterase/lipase